MRDDENITLQLIPVANVNDKSKKDPAGRAVISCPTCGNSDQIYFDNIALNDDGSTLTIELSCACGAELEIDIPRFGD